MAASFAGVFYVGVTTARTTSGAAQKLVVTSVGSVSTASTIHRLGGISTTNLRIELGGQMFETSLADPNVSVQVFDAHFIGPESEADALVQKARTLFDDPEKALPEEKIDSVYRNALLAFKRQVTHCAIGVMRIEAA